MLCKNKSYKHSIIHFIYSTEGQQLQQKISYVHVHVPGIWTVYVSKLVKTNTFYQIKPVYNGHLINTWRIDPFAATNLCNMLCWKNATKSSNKIASRRKIFQGRHLLYFMYESTHKEKRQQFFYLCAVLLKNNYVMHCIHIYSVWLYMYMYNSKEVNAILVGLFRYTLTWWPWQVVKATTRGKEQNII